MLSRRTAALAALALLCGCGGPQGDGAKATGSKGTDVAGAGATFPAPVYSKWAQGYAAGGGGRINYQAIGSGGGIKQIKAGTVDFGATDKPLKAEELQQAGLVQFPTVIGGVVPVVNLAGVQPDQLKLSGQVLGQIYLGQVKRWNDPAIAGLNPGLKLPATPITVVHRSDGSGTTFLFTSYLAAKNPAWASKVGASDAVSWPTGIAGKGNDGVAAFVKQTAGSIGYVEYVYAKQNRMSSAVMQGHDGQFVAPTAQSFAAAAAGADWSKAPGMGLLLLDQPGAGAWPITGATFILVHRAQAKPAQGEAVLKFFDWAYRNGDQQAQALDYVPLPAPVKDMARRTWSDVKGSDGKAVYAPGPTP